LFQKFTEKAITAVRDAQISAIELGHKKIYPEHLLWALSKKTTELGAKILKMNHASPEKIKDALVEVLKDKEIKIPASSVLFSNRIRKVFQKADEIASENGNGFVKTEHLFYVLLCDEAGLDELYNKLYLDKEKVRDIMKKIVEKKSKPKEKHPEGFEQKEVDEKYNHILSLVKDPESAAIFSKAVAKLTTSEYEILGTEQIMLSILDDESGELGETLKNAGITYEKFSDRLKQVTSRLAEYEDKQIIFTPNALTALVKASETARELGIDIDTIRKASQEKSSSFAYSLNNGPLVLPINDQVYATQAKIIKHLAEKEDCIIVNGCANYILEDHPHVLRIFVYAPLESRIERVEKDYKEEHENTKKYVQKRDKQRKSYYNYYTTNTWANMKDYDLCINSDMGIDEIAQLIVKVYQNGKLWK